MAIKVLISTMIFNLEDEDEKKNLLSKYESEKEEKSLHELTIEEIIEISQKEGQKGLDISTLEKQSTQQLTNILQHLKGSKFTS